MEILNEFSQEGLEAVIKVLRNDGVAVVPTDTVYGLVCNALNEGAVGKIFKIKKRSEEKTLPIFVKNLETVKKYAVIDNRLVPFLERVWPGKVTVVLRTTTQINADSYADLRGYKPILPTLVGGINGTIGIRISDSPFIFRLFDEIDFPLAQTSANIAGEKEAVSVEEVLRYFQEAGLKPDLVIDGGRCSGTPSTIVDLSDEAPKILREGAISTADMERLFRETGLGWR